MLQSSEVGSAGGLGAEREEGCTRSIGFFFAERRGITRGKAATRFRAQFLFLFRRLKKGAATAKSPDFCASGRRSRLEKPFRSVDSLPAPNSTLKGRQREAALAAGRALTKAVDLPRVAESAFLHFPAISALSLPFLSSESREPGAAWLNPRRRRPG